MWQTEPVCRNPNEYPGLTGFAGGSLLRNGTFPDHQ